jgi:hypothetical protein
MTTASPTTDVAGERQLLRILDLFAALHWRDDPPPDRLAEIGERVLRGRDRGATDSTGPDVLGRLSWWPGHLDLVVSTPSGPIALRALIKPDRAYAVCGVYPRAEGAERHTQIAWLAAILRPALAAMPEEGEALRDALRRMGGHWARVLVRQLEAE